MGAMKTKKQVTKPAGTRELLEKVAPNLYRHRGSGSYYGIKKAGGKRRVHALGTADRKVAERKLAEWIKGVAETDATASNLTLGGLFARYRAVLSGKPKTIETKETILRLFERTFERGMGVPLAKVRPSEIAAWFSKNCEHMRNGSFNSYRRVLAEVFQLAVEDRVIPAPGFFSKKLIPKKKKQDVVRNIPTTEQFAAILAHIRANTKFQPYAQGADFIEFLGLAGVGQAEASALRWEDIDWDAGEIRFRRVKTSKAYTIPLFQDLRAFLEARRQAAGPVFKIHDCFDVLAGATLALGFPHFSPRNLRSMRIVAFLDAGVDVKQVAEWQAHSDGGKLIWDTYSNVVRSDKNAYLNEQIARAEGRIVRFQEHVPNSAQAAV